MSRKNVIALKCMFERLRKYSSEKNYFWMGRYLENIEGYIRALFHCGVIEEVTYNRIYDIANSLSTYGNYDGLKKVA